VKRASAKSSLAPKTLAHQAKDVPNPSQAPQSEDGSIVIVAEAIGAIELKTGYRGK